MKCSVLDYVQILMISKAIRAMKVNQPTQNGQFRTIRNSSNLVLTEVAQNDSEWPISHDLQLFQSFPTEVAQNDSERPISPNLQLF